MLRIGICDDERQEVEQQAWLLEQCLMRLGHVAHIIKCISGEELLMAMEEHGNFDFVLLDIEMGGMDGIAAAERIRSVDYQAVLIFISAHDSYCKRAIGVQPFAFLDKPLTEEALYETLRKAFGMYHFCQESYCFSWNRVGYRVPFGEILYFFSEGRVVHLVTVTGKHRFYGKLDEVERSVQKKWDAFLRIHKSYLVNRWSVAEFHYEKLVLKNGEELPISRGRRDAVREWYFSRLAEQMKE